LDADYDKRINTLRRYWGSGHGVPHGCSDGEPLRVDFERRLKQEFHGNDISSDGGLLPYRELDHALGLTELGGEVLSETRRGKNTRYLLVGFLRQSVFGWLAGYEDVNDAERLSHDPVMRAIVDPKGLERMAASTSQTGSWRRICWPPSPTLPRSAICWPSAQSRTALPRRLQLPGDYSKLFLRRRKHLKPLATTPNRRS